MKQHLDLKPTNEPNQTNQTKPNQPKNASQKLPNQTKPKNASPKCPANAPPNSHPGCQVPRGLDLLQVPFDLEISGLPEVVTCRIGIRRSASGSGKELGLGFPHYYGKNLLIHILGVVNYKAVPNKTSDFFHFSRDF